MGLKEGASINEVNAGSTPVPAVGQISTNSTNTFSAAGPFNTTISLTHGKSSYVDTSQYPDDLNMPALEDITYSDDEEDVGVEADLSNLEMTITISPFPITRVHKDHPEEGIDYEEDFAPVARIEVIRLFLAYASFMGFMVYQMDVKSGFLYGTIEEEVYVCQPPVFEDPDYPDKRGKIDQTLFIKKQKDGKSASTSINTEKPLLKDLDGKDVDVHTYRAQVGDLSSYTTKYSFPALTQKVFANIRRVGKGFSGVETPLFEGMIVAQQADDVADKGYVGVDVDDVPLEPTKLKELVELVTTAKLITEVVTVAAATITGATTPIIAATIIVAPSAARRRKGVVIRDPEETATPSIIIHSKPKSKDKGKGIMVQEPKPLKKKTQIKQDEAYARELKAELNKNINWDDVIEQVQRKEKENNVVLRMSYDDIPPIFEKYFNLNVAFLEKTKEQLEEEESRALKRTSESLEEKAAKKQKLDEEVEELKKHLQIVPNDDDDIYTKDTPLALKVPVVDYEIYSKNNKPYYKIKRADGSH
nr:putative ribonuclease H-like domain-containing protein [Tanacetum cinerariifolium]